MIGASYCENTANEADVSGWHVAGGLTHLSLDVRSTPAATGVEVKSSRDKFDIPHLYLVRGGLGRWSLG